MDLVVETPLPPLPVSAQTARRAVCSAMAGWPDESVGTAELLASELVTNAVRHATAPVALRLLLEPSRARLEVRDGSATAPRVIDDPGDELALSGRGMTLVEALAEAWGVDPNPGDGKTVWCVIRA